jgi:hypothetical protein
MSRLAELLKQKSPPANSANRANPDLPISSISKISRRVSANSLLPPGLEERMRAMFVRWIYSHDDAELYLDLARSNPAEWLINVANDEKFHAKLLAEDWPLPQ